MQDTAALRQVAVGAVVADAVHVLINHTGGPPGGLTHSAMLGAFEMAFLQHVLAGQALLNAVLPGMRGGGYERIIDNISTSVKQPIAGPGVSNTARVAVSVWAKTLAGELAVDGITINSVRPGYARTQRLDSQLAAQVKSSGRTEQDVAESFLVSVPAKRFGEAAEVATVVAFLCAPAAAYVNRVSISGDGGRTETLS
jgi:3-oxoacyl-[acyl-carrier protein] reductase